VRGKLPPDRTAEDGLATLLLAEAIYRSAAAGRTERVAPVAEALEKA
jgi:predicted dehydrogenase